MGKHAYLILAHTDMVQLQRLISCLDDRRNDIYVHIDKKAVFEDKAFEVFRPSIDARCERDYLDVSSLAAYQCGSLRYDTALQQDGKNIGTLGSTFGELDACIAEMLSNCF